MSSKITASATASVLSSGLLTLVQSLRRFIGVIIGGGGGSIPIGNLADVAQVIGRIMSLMSCILIVLWLLNLGGNLEDLEELK